MQIIDGACVQYDPTRALECRAITSLDDMTPYNFLDHFDQRTANERALACARELTRMILGWREERVENALPLPDVSDVYEFIGNRLGMQPYGRLVYVDQMPDAKSSGFTTAHNLRSVVIRSHIEQDFQEGEVSEDFAIGANGLRVEGVAAHELTHLAGMQDKAFFTVSEDGRHPVDIAMAGPALEIKGKNERGTYLEEGLASLVQGMYCGYVLGDVVQHDKQTLPYRSPKGILLHMPERINMYGHQEYAFCGWGMERLVDADSDIWDVLIASRRYGARSSVIRAELRKRIERISRGLFNRIDTTNIDDLDSNMETTDRIDYAVKQYKS
jgi:hypothetical protein